MRSVYLQTVARFLLPVFVILSLFLLLRGHNAPGGGFTGGLICSAGIALYAMAYGTALARRLLRVDLRVLLGIGLLIALASGIVGMLPDREFFTARWVSIRFDENNGVKLGTPIFFDIGVFLVVVGMCLSIILSHLEELEGRR